MGIGSRERIDSEESLGIPTSSLLELKALDMGREKPADLQLGAEVVVVGRIKV